MKKWINIDDRIPTKEDGWIHQRVDMSGHATYYINVLAFETGGYGKRVRMREFRLLLIGEWGTDNEECEIATGAFMDSKYADWTVSHWMALPDAPDKNNTEDFRPVYENHHILCNLDRHVPPKNCKQCIGFFNEEETHDDNDN